MNINNLVKNKSFSTVQLEYMENMYSTSLPEEYKKFLIEFGVPRFLESDYGIYFKNNNDELIFPFSHFYDYDELISSKAILQTDDEFQSLSKDDEYLIVAEGHGQHFFLLKLNSSEKGSVFLYSVEDVSIQFLNKNIMSFITARFENYKP